MMSKKGPQLRFKGFTDAWEEFKLGDAVSISSGVTGDATLQDGKYRLTRIESISQGMLNVARLGFTNEKPDQKYLLNLGDILYSNINSLSHIGKVALVDTTGIYHGINLLRFQMRNGVDSEFLFQRLNTMPMKNWAVSHANPAVSQASINQTELSKQPISSPTLTEQQQIGNFFKEIDNIIGLHQRKLDLLKEQKKGYLQKMFPKAGEKIPELRFKGFTGDWERREFNELVEQVIREVPKPDEPYYRMSVRSHAKGTFKQFVDDPNKVAMDKLYVVKKDDLVLNITFAWEHAIAVVSEDSDGLLVSHRFPTYRADGKSDIVFLKYLVSKEEFRRNLESISPGGAGRNRVLNKKDFLKLKVMVPNREEQKKIGSFFKQLDDTIALHQRKLDLLKEQKKG